MHEKWARENIFQCSFIFFQSESHMTAAIFQPPSHTLFMSHMNNPCEEYWID